ncbi:hypothetical protein J2S34_002339 [Nitrobacter winogradskyi]|uniref:Uncharacterized protein n=1 Tax=Nitrobacter winogradskyi TaxID=913 RepID=A0ACC6AJP3_NITWI|nr:hypothetical protein [Nitrobacter winogradskyi]
MFAQVALDHKGLLSGSDHQKEALLVGVPDNVAPIFGRWQTLDCLIVQGDTHVGHLRTLAISETVFETVLAE